MLTKRNALLAFATAVAMTGCVPLPPNRPVCQEAGFGAREVQNLLPDIQAAHDAGASREQVLTDAQTACQACATASPPCVEESCVACFALLIDEVYDAEETEE